MVHFTYANLSNPIISLKILIERYFIPNPKSVKYGYRNSGGKPSYVDDRIDFTPGEIAKSSFYVAPYHGANLI
jgi:hypothetical protein